MAHAEVCPICNGSGTVAIPYDPNTTSVSMHKVCRGCNGVGWVTVGVEYPHPRYAKDGTVFCRYCGTALGLKDEYDPDVPNEETP